MPITHFDKESIKQSITGKLMRYYGVSIEDATLYHLYRAVASTVRDQIMPKWMEYREKEKANKGKRLYYLSIEFLLGRMLNNNLVNLCYGEEYLEALRELGIELPSILPEEPEPALGNGGLGRLAACFLDSLATLSLPATGCTLRYEYGLFRQKIVEGQQVELPDNWLQNGNIWEIASTDETCLIQFGGQVEEYYENERICYRVKDAYIVEAVPYDMPVIGYDNTCVNTLRAWSARSRSGTNLFALGNIEYLMVKEEMRIADEINRSLYPEDKMIRLHQQYFFVSATLQAALKRFHKDYGANWDLMPDKVVFHINDTHPGLAFPEMMRLLVDQEGLSWDMAHRITCRCMAYTNHTVMAEALEHWPLDSVRSVAPRIMMILEEMNRRLCEHLFINFPDQWERIGHMAIVSYGQVHMANLCAALSYSVNGVSTLHGQILTNSIFHDYWLLNKGKFSAITNGITHRRWLLAANPGLSGLIKESIGDGFVKDPGQLALLKPFADDVGFRDAFERVKKTNKERLASFIQKRQGETIDTDFIFDVQAKRLHEYKRQLLNALHIQVLYNRLAGDSSIEMTPRLFLFGAKAAPSYWRAKQIIRYINALAALIAKNQRVSQMLKIVYLENYDVSTAEMLMPAAEISQQLSTAGKEASGTGNMKFMMNGAVTMGTLDGANVEIADQVGMDNIYIFGMRAETVESMYRERQYNPMGIYETNYEIHKALNQWMDGSLFPNEPLALQDLYKMLLVGDHGNMADPYFVLKDFGSYSMSNRRIVADYANRGKWLRMAVINVAMSGVFSSDRTIEEYNDRIWRISPIL